MCICFACLQVRDTAYRERSPKAGSDTPGKARERQRVRKPGSEDLPPGWSFSFDTNQNFAAWEQNVLPNH